jgi:hypothetical protein
MTSPISRFKPTRRKFMGYAGKAGMGIVAAAAGLTATSNAAWAGNAACCTLAYPPGSPNYCRVDGWGNYICPSGHAWSAWYCCSGSRTYACAECNNGTGCNVFPIYCSAYWTVNPNSCTASMPASALVPKADAADLARWKSNPWGPTPTQQEAGYEAPITVFPSGNTK